jgi:hypothetical protein
MTYRIVKELLPITEPKMFNGYIVSIDNDELFEYDNENDAIEKLNELKNNINYSGREIKIIEID